MKSMGSQVIRVVTGTGGFTIPSTLRTGVSPLQRVTGSDDNMS